MIEDFIATLSSNHGTKAARVKEADLQPVHQLLLERFFGNVKRDTGQWIRDEYRWHAYTFNHETAISGDEAYDRYRNQPVEQFYVFHEFEDFLLTCVADAWPDVRAFADDIYVFPHNMTWLFTTTHEMTNGLGPFFAHHNDALSE